MVMLWISCADWDLKETGWLCGRLLQYARCLVVLGIDMVRCQWQF